MDTEWTKWTAEEIRISSAVHFVHSLSIPLLCPLRPLGRLSFWLKIIGKKKMCRSARSSRRTKLGLSLGFVRSNPDLINTSFVGGEYFEVELVVVDAPAFGGDAAGAMDDKAADGVVFGVLRDFNA